MLQQLYIVYLNDGKKLLLACNLKSLLFRESNTTMALEAISLAALAGFALSAGAALAIY